MKNGRVCLILGAVVLIAVSAKGAPDASPWSLKELKEVPDYSWGETTSGLRTLRFKGPPYQGNPTEVYALFASPETLNPETASKPPYPGIVLLHGGGGQAYEDWVKLWAERGYAALAIDQGSAENPSKAPGPPMGKQLQQWDKPAKDRWFYHAPANAILAHSLLRSLPEVASDQVALHGISWGGFVTTLAASLDFRFVCAVPVYGCGFLDEGSRWQKTFQRLPLEQQQDWKQRWDPAAYLSESKVPFLLINGTEDPFFHYPAHRATAEALPNAKVKWQPELKHGHTPGWSVPEIFAFVDHHTGKTTASLPKLGRPEMQDGEIQVPYRSDVGLVAGDLWGATDPGPYHLQPKEEPKGRSKFFRQPAVIENGLIKAKLPSDTKAYFVSATDKQGLTVTTSIYDKQ